MDTGQKASKYDYLILPAIIALALYIAFIPHHNYPYPVHLDEWTNLVFSQTTIKAGSITFPDPLAGQVMEHPDLEAGFHVFWGVFHQISGISWLTIPRYFPGVIFIITVLSVYILTRREGFGWEAAFFTCLVPTTVGLLGPGFLVAVAMGLPFIPLSLFIAFNFRTGWSYLALFIFTGFLLSIHAVTAVVLLIILAPYILLNLKSDLRHSLLVALAVIVPFFVLFPWVSSLLWPTAKSLLSAQALLPYVDLPRIVHVYGYAPILFCLLGSFVLVMRRTKIGYGLVSGLLAILVVLATFYVFGYGVTILYYRGLVDMMLMASIVAGAGLMGLRNLRLPARLISRLKPTFIIQNAGNILGLVLIGVTLAVCIPIHQHTPYYHMIDTEEYEAFTWVRDNVGSAYDKAILDPWKATAFAAITGKSIYSRIGSYPTASDEEAYTFLHGGSKDTTFLRNNGISIVYTTWGNDNPDLVEVRKNVFLLKEAKQDNSGK